MSHHRSRIIGKGRFTHWRVLVFAFWIWIFVLVSFAISATGLAQLKSIKAEDTRTSRLRLYQGIEQAVNGYWETACQNFGEALEHNPQNQEAILCHLITFDIIDGKLSENDGEDLFIAIEAWIYSDNQKAKTIFKSILATNRNYALIYYFKGMNELSMDAFSEAKIDFNSVIDLDPDMMFAYVKRGQLSARLGKYDRALEDLNKAIEMDSIFYETYYERGTIYQALKAYKKSVDDYERAFYLYPPLKQTLYKSLKICEGYNNLGMVYLKNGAYKEALNNFNDAIIWNPLFYEPYLNRGITYRHLNYFDAALSDFNFALGLDSTNVDVYFNLALTFEQMGEIDKALDYLILSNNSDTLYNEAYLKKGEIYYSQRQFAQATLMFEKVLAIDDKNCWGYYWVGLSYDAEKKYPEAIKAYEIFIKIAPEEYYDQKVKVYERAERLKRWINRKKW